MSNVKITALPNQDWHPWDIKAALGKKGYSFARIARENGYAKTSANEALRRSWPAIERLIADIIGVEPWEIWPTRYNDQNQPLRFRYSSRPSSRKIA